jgi:hypothetical protein
MRQWTREQLEEYIRREIQRTIDESIAHALVYGVKPPLPPQPQAFLTGEECTKLLAGSYAMPIIQRPEAMAIITADMMVGEPWPKEMERSYTSALLTAARLELPLPGIELHTGYVYSGGRCHG